MALSQQIHQSILEYQEIVNELKTLSRNTEDKYLRSTLEESAHRLRMCIHECEFASRQVL